MLGGWTLYQDAEPQEYTARLFVPNAERQREAFELIRDRDGYTEGFVTICYQTRRFELGLVDPAHRNSARFGATYQGRNWKERIKRDALAALCRGVEISVERVRIVDAGLAR